MPQAAVMPALSADETKRKAELIGIVNKNRDATFALANALRELKEQKLYRDTHTTFEKFCHEVLQISRRHGIRLVEAAQVLENVTHGSQNGDAPKPQIERQTRELAKAPPEKQADAWEAAVEDADGEQPTAKQVKAAVEKVTAPPVTEKPVVKDQLGNNLPEKFHIAFRDLPKFEEVRKSINAIIRDCESLAASAGGAFIIINAVRADLNNAKKHLMHYAPYTVCHYCKGKGCQPCRHNGWVYKTIHDQKVKQ